MRLEEAYSVVETEKNARCVALVWWVELVCMCHMCAGLV